MDGEQSRINTEALTKATEALVRIDAHEKICSERYEEITSGQKAIFNKLDDISTSNFNRWLLVAGAVITLLIGVVGFFVGGGNIG